MCRKTKGTVCCFLLTVHVSCSPLPFIQDPL
jgi:hypothetical protein